VKITHVTTRVLRGGQLGPGWIFTLALSAIDIAC